MLGVGLYTTFLVIMSYLLILKMDGHVTHARGVAIALLGLTSMAITMGLSHFASSISRIVVITTGVTTVLLVQVPLFSHLLGLSPLSIKEWMIVIAASSLNFLLVRK